ncbi:hypothetical protein ALC62_03230 [Cyphomyrmex costatus]|uniref:Mutator-like transposase domain-containing protein n=1 Tax=Cyphomyrmex costatus TaxID=456900 RepID=A0A151ILU1_9HYME|nr:hypothetical protein ALC62_03230 [Cyphomyrmex costatus]
MSDKVYTGHKGSKSTSTTTKRSKISNQKPPNRHSLDSVPEFLSASAKKLKTDNAAEHRAVDEYFGYRFINFVTVFTTISQMIVCKKCKGDVRFTEESKRGLGFKIAMTCNDCGAFKINNCPLINNHSYEINIRMTLVMRILGIGLNGMKKFCAMMDLPKPIFQSTYDLIVKSILTASTSVRNLSMEKAAKQEIKENNEIIVSGDGTWRKRGFSSLFGLVTLIGWFTGKVLDVCVKSKYCKSCEFWKKREGSAEYEEWAENHNLECQCNHSGSAGKMEVDAVTEMFQRSETLHNVKYGSYIGDGDSKTFKGLLEAKPYDDFTVTKKECIDHVQKRMGTRLRNLKKKTKGLGGRGKLTGKLIDELSIYYGLAIRRNSESVEKMRNEIYATLNHKISTDDNPQHDNCSSSWCSWKQAQDSGTLDAYKHKPAMPDDVYAAIKPIYDELSSEDLLFRCLGGYTQNSNESFNSVVWSIAPKTVSSGKGILDVATNIAVITFNDGLCGIMNIMDVIGITVSRQCFDFCVADDSRRIKAAERSMTEAAKTGRRDAKSQKKELEKLDVDAEGQLYGAGIAE